MNRHHTGYLRRIFATTMGLVIVSGLSQSAALRADGKTPVVRPATVSTPERPGRPPSDAVVLFQGHDLSEWVGPGGKEPGWKLGDSFVEIVPGSGSLRTRRSIGDCQLHIEWAAPAVVRGHGQGRGNSGVLIMGRYEVQVLDSYQNQTYADGQAGSIYGQYPPLVNASRPPGEWQTYDIVFRGPRFDESGALVKLARVLVLHNGVLIHDNVELMGPVWVKMPRNYRPHPPALPLLLQDHHCPVRYRNIWYRPLPEETDIPLTREAAERRDRMQRSLKWEVNDPQRPQPPVITPGRPGTDDRPGVPPSDAEVLFPAPASTWTTPPEGTDSLAVKGRLQTRARFASVQVHAEYRVKTSSAPCRLLVPGGQSITLVGTGAEPPGTVNGKRPPLVVANRALGEWQRCDIVLRLPQPSTDSGALRNGHLSLFLNGVLVQDHIPVAPVTSTVSAPVTIEDADGATEFRLLWVRRL